MFYSGAGDDGQKYIALYFNGAGDGIRTRDINLGKVAL